ncbi:exonuclease SbcCD subunit D C-terminal domain-containing protein [Larsenimonas salina]|uniref:exonuclease SbcCD subunit D C-terminal domain-containing protein n=1 Tax=Larsenimonas salina TaxID=1295565 RepID=UPI002072C23E|nr:exonuclease SbcCD subunit D C-terminal domain-containing protein [Larsenimonas salina]MCM5703829.1 exonuclease SbcCD subunit D C-terminal domain-containing protein [Larsenimonas salina]
MLTFLHTADWHLGQNFHGHDRQAEHRAFLDWLLSIIDEEDIDALLIAGDIFDVVNPSIEAQRLLFDFITRAHTQRPSMDIVMIAGNHDSAARIELPAPLLAGLNTHALGQLHSLDPGDLNRLLVPLTNADGEREALCVALPFLRPSDVTGRGLSDYQAGMAHAHQAVFDHAKEATQPGEAVIAMGHAHVRGAAVSEHSERPIVLGGEESISAALYPDSLAYVALGHLHKPQRVNANVAMRYSGSPIALDMSERHYPRQVVIGHIDQGTLRETRSRPIPDHTSLHRIGPACLSEVLAELAALPDTVDGPPPWLDVHVELDAPHVALRGDIDTHLAGKPYRLVAIQTRYHGDAQRDIAPAPRLEDLTPEALFTTHWERAYGAPPEEDVLTDFRALAQSVHDDEAAL